MWLGRGRDVVLNTADGRRARLEPKIEDDWENVNTWMKSINHFISNISAIFHQYFSNISTLQILTKYSSVHPSFCVEQRWSPPFVPTMCVPTMCVPTSMCAPTQLTIQLNHLIHPITLSAIWSASMHAANCPLNARMLQANDASN